MAGCLISQQSPAGQLGKFRVGGSVEVRSQGEGRHIDLFKLTSRSKI